jgi:kynureninase
MSRDEAVALDDADPLRAFRDRFVDDDPSRIYLDGNSLGRLPLATRDRLAATVAQWGAELVSGWHDWIDAPRGSATCWPSTSSARAPAR